MADITDIALRIGDDEVTSAAGAIFTVAGAVTEDNPRVIYSDIDYALLSGADFGLLQNDESVKGSVWNIINTKLGERVMMPTFGLNIRDFLFEPMTWDVIRLIQFSLIRAFNDWDPRISTDNVQILSTATESNTVEIMVTLRIKGLNSELPLIIKGNASQF
jgi:phage baseplate assembly protein W